MPVIDFTKDVDKHSITITAHFAAPVERVWELYADPRQLEKVWGPPHAPATFVDHSLTVGSRSSYFMTDDDGNKFAGWWRITEVDEPSRFTFDDGFADSDLNDHPDLPVSHNEYTFESDPEGTKAVFVSVFESAEGLEKVLAMGVQEGWIAAVNQIDGFLAA